MPGEHSRAPTRSRDLPGRGTAPVIAARCDRHRLPRQPHQPHPQAHPGQKTANRVLAVGRAPVEHGFAHLKNWRTLTKFRSDPARTTHLLRALLVLTNLEVNR
ncbi:transposase family protein [Streptomyces sp. NPDC047841]|uniref:transposase family protein n=1 Tax=Streptomyces sp. NPDC047841 TaxID=3154708 RepID=UPI003452DB3F